jgi:hypothetical protein
VKNNVLLGEIKNWVTFGSANHPRKTQLHKHTKIRLETAIITRFSSTEVKLTLEWIFRPPHETFISRLTIPLVGWLKRDRQSADEGLVRRPKYPL